MTDRVILHSDLNNYFASVECLYNPEIRDLPVAVCGDPELRHGIVLAKNYHAKICGIITGEVIWQARQKCPNLVVIKPNQDKYIMIAKLVRKIYADYSDQIEPFGVDEAWVDVTGSAGLYGGGEAIADLIRKRIRDEIGITASVGVSFNKIFAKLASDLKKPDATIPVTRENFKTVVWSLPASALLWVGRSTKEKLYRSGIKTIGDIAAANPVILKNMLGKWGEVIHCFANGNDDSPVATFGDEGIIKSIGNTTTPPRDLKDNEEVKVMLTVLSESVAARMREHNFKARTVQLHVRDCELAVFERQKKMERATDISGVLAAAAMELFRANYSWQKPIRSIGVRATDFLSGGEDVQTSLMVDEERIMRKEKIERTLDSIRGRFGYFSVQRAMMLTDKRMTSLNPKEEHVIHPVSYF
ncbi:MAG: DNA polymerase IV [Eubacteriales bacterium]